MDFVYSGKTYPKLYALTITTRSNSYTEDEFKSSLTKFLKSIEYPCRISGNLEIHKRRKQIHFHGMTCRGQPPKNNKTNEFYFHLTKIDCNPALWLEYMYKDYQMKICLFDE